MKNFQIYFYKIQTSRPLKPLTYFSNKKLTEGQLVKVELKNKEEFGIVFSETEIRQGRVKEIKEIGEFIYDEKYLIFFKSLSTKEAGTVFKNSKNVLEKIFDKHSVKFNSEKKYEEKLLIGLPKTPKNILFIGPSEKSKFIYSEILKENFFGLKNIFIFPFATLDSIVILEYTKNDLFFYPKTDISVIKIAEKFAKSLNIPLIFQSNSPFLKDFEKFENKEINLKISPSTAKIISIKTERESGNKNLFSEFSKEEIAKSKKTLVIWNKKSAGYFECNECGEIYFDFVEICKTCKGIKFTKKNKGLKEVANEIKKDLQKDVEIISAEFSKKESNETLQNFGEKFEVLVSTTFFADNFSFLENGVDLIVIPMVEILGFSKDELSDERYFQKIFEICFEASKAKIPVIIQTFEINDPIVQFGAFFKLKEFYQWLKNENNVEPLQLPL